MNILAIDTSASYLSLALDVNNKVYTFIDKVGNNQSENVIPQIKNLLDQANVEISSIDAIAYNQGPGSFTGLRIGISVAIGIAFGIKAKLIPIPAFAIYANQAYAKHSCEKVLVGLDARLNQLYLAGVTMPDFGYFISPKLVNPEDVEIPSQVTIIGNGFIEYKDKFLNKDFELIEDSYPEPIHILTLAKSGMFKLVEPRDADLLYLRDKVALNIEEQKHAHKIS